MQRKETFSEYLYHSLREEIISGRVPLGSVLPSTMRLSELYHVGARIVQDIMVRLRQEGYIEAEKRRPMIVIHRQDQRKQGSAAIRYIVEDQHSLRDAHATMTLIMPCTLSFSVQVRSDYALYRLGKKVKKVSAKNAAF